MVDSVTNTRSCVVQTNFIRRVAEQRQTRNIKKAVLSPTWDMKHVVDKHAPSVMQTLFSSANVAASLATIFGVGYALFGGDARYLGMSGGVRRDAFRYSFQAAKVRQAARRVMVPVLARCRNGQWCCWSFAETHLSPDQALW